MNNNLIESIWYIKHRPSTLEQYLFTNDQHQHSFTEMCKLQTIPHLLLAGGAGTGKTTISQILINNCIDPDNHDLDVLKLNASDTNSVDDIRTQVYGHITSSCLSKYKIVWLEEADYLSPNAQGILRDYMETYEQHCRFILTCNQLHKIIPALRSRCQQFFFKNSDEQDILEMTATILITEKIKCDLPTLTKHVKIHYPDIRAIINSVEQHSTTGVLLPPSTTNAMADIKSNLLTYIENDKWDELRQHVVTSVADEELDDIYEFLYNNLDSSKHFKRLENWEEAIVLIADHLHKHLQHSKPIINMAALLIQIKHIGK